MTKIEFKEAMLRGLGRCVTAVREEPEKYRDIILWACTRDIAYDTQSEGTRAWYVYTLASCYPDREPFIIAATEALKKYRPKGGWDLAHMSELLMYFADDGIEFARQVVEEKYQEILASLINRKSRPNRVFHELSDLEHLGVVLAEDRASFLCIARDFGRLYREKGYMLDGDFCWFFSSKGGQFRKAMERSAEKNADIACFLRREQADIEVWEKLREQRSANPMKELKGIRLSRWLATRADRQTVVQYALAYQDQTDPALRASALEAFAWCPYPMDPQPILDDTFAGWEALRSAAWRALENLRHRDVRAFALKNVEKGIRTCENFALLVTNYIPEDDALLETLLKEMIAAKQWDEVHAAGLDIHRAFYKDSRIPHPKHLLPLLYEYNPCARCRESELVYMSRHKMLTKAVLEECVFDSNEDIRRMAAKRLK